MDPALQFEKQVVLVAQNAVAELHLICLLSLSLASTDLATLIQVFVTLWLHYRNLLYNELPLKTSQTLKLVQMVAGCFLSGAR